MKKGDISIETVVKLLLAFIILLILVIMFFSLQDKAISEVLKIDATSILESLKGGG